MWAFGHHLTIPEDMTNIDLQDYLEMVRTLTGFPFEGIVLQDKDAEKGMSYTLNPSEMNTRSLAWMTSQNLSIVPISYSGYPVDGQVPDDPITKEISMKNYEIRTLSGGIYHAFGDNGVNLFIDYSIPQVSDVLQIMYSGF